MTRPGIEPGSPGPMANTSTVKILISNSVFVVLIWVHNLIVVVLILLNENFSWLLVFLFFRGGGGAAGG